MRKLRKSRRNPFEANPRRRRRLSPLILVGVVVSLVVALVGAAVFLLPRLESHAAAVAAVNGDCNLIVPANPLTAQGLATPYRLRATDPGKGPCNESNASQAAFVQAAVFNPATNRISIYDPLVIDDGTQPAVAPVVPQFPANAVVAIWFGFNGNNLTLQSHHNSLQDGNCVNGLQGSIFGQVSYCNAPAFFQAANQAIQAGKLIVPPLGKAKDGLTCPTVRDFSVVDQDQSDNVTSSYLVMPDGRTAQMTLANATALQNDNAQAQTNGSDNRLLAIALDGALGCTPWMAPDLANPGQMTTALPLDELQAAADQAQPVALVPAGDPMVLDNGNININKVNAYRAGVDQLPVQAGTQNSANTRDYCSNLLAIAPPRLQLDASFTSAGSSPVPAAANNLFTFLAQRFVFSFGPNGLNCTQ
ncbi:MAG TPA: hypothetical protein VKR83_15345, partial [Ktedonobacteraceae bacterium]|nr:hypothetical protein [Ktedonobacteraceae bacterium]